MADSLFDVLLFDSLGNFQDYVGRNLPFTGAIALSRGVNDTRKRLQPTAVVLPAGLYDQQCEAELQVQEQSVELYHQGQALNLDAMHDAKTEVRGKAQEARKTGFPGTEESRTFEAIRDLASDALSDASSESDDSEADQDSENAAEAKKK